MTRISPTILLEMSSIDESLAAAVANGSLLEAAKSNISSLLAGTTRAVKKIRIAAEIRAGLCTKNGEIT